MHAWARERKEFVLQRGILKVARSNGMVDAATMFSAPRPLHHGKAAWNLLTTFSEFHLPLRHFTKGPCLVVAIFDGLHCSSLRRMIPARQRLYYEQLRLSAERDGDADAVRELDTGLLEQTDNSIVLHCVMHVFNLALKWAVSPWSSADYLENFHIAIKSCNRSSWAIHDQIHSFIRAHVVPYTIVPGTATLAGRAKLWQLIVRGASFLELFEESWFWFDPTLNLVFIRPDFFAGLISILLCILQCCACYDFAISPTHVLLAHGILHACGFRHYLWVLTCLWIP